MALLLIVAAILWYAFGDPAKDIANWFWADDAAPWETVDAYYYPDRSDLSRHQSALGLGSVAACRSWVRAAAASFRDPGMQRGDWECGVGEVEAFAGLKVYRITVR